MLACSSCVWMSHIESETVWHANTSDGCVAACAPHDARCWVGCPGGVVDKGRCGPADPTCAEARTPVAHEVDGSCDEAVPSLEAKGENITSCRAYISGSQSALRIGAVAVVVGVVALVVGLKVTETPRDD